MSFMAVGAFLEGTKFSLGGFLSADKTGFPAVGGWDSSDGPVWGLLADTLRRGHWLGPALTFYLPGASVTVQKHTAQSILVWAHWNPFEPGKLFPDGHLGSFPWALHDPEPVLSFTPRVKPKPGIFWLLDFLCSHMDIYKGPEIIKCGFFVFDCQRFHFMGTLSLSFPDATIKKLMVWNLMLEHIWRH